jgi:tetratricopeptide (TPR) repeat protein
MLETRSLDAQLESAREIAGRDGRDAAVSCLRNIVENGPASPSTVVRVAALLVELGCEDEADEILRDGVLQYPDSREVLAAYASGAQRRGDGLQGANRWKDYSQRFGDDPNGYAIAAAALLELGRIDEAEGLLEEGVRQHPANGHLLAVSARVAERRADWPEALARWTAFREQLPHDPVGYAGVGIALGQLAVKQFREADIMLEEALRRFPGNGQSLGTYARLAVSRRDWPEALRRWKISCDYLPNDPACQSGLGNALRELGRFDEADKVFAKAVERWPDHPELLSSYARLAYDRQDWPAALERWRSFCSRFPSDTEGHRYVMLILNELGRFDEGSRAYAEAVFDLASDKNLAELMLRFEALGDNCEFGVVQRHFGAEPLGLLRFTFTPPELLIAALQAKFAGVGDPDNTILSTNLGEYVTKDTRYTMSMHTQLREGEGAMDRDQTFALVCRRLRYLRDNLLSDLEDAEKHFVYADRGSPSDDDARAMWRALRQYGENRLLLVRLEVEGHPAGTIRVLEDGLVIGYIEKLSVEHPAYATWLHLCKQVDTMWRRAADHADAAAAAETAPAVQMSPLVVPPTEVILARPGSVCIEPPSRWVRAPAEFVVDLSGADLQHTLLHENQHDRHGTYRNRFEDALAFGHQHFHAVLTPDNTIYCQQIEFGRACESLDAHIARHPRFNLPMPYILRDGEGYGVSMSHMDVTATVDVPGSVYFATPAEPLNWGAWIFHGLPAAVDFVTNRPAERYLTFMALPWQRDLLRAVGVPDETLVHQELGRTYRCKEVVFRQYSRIDTALTPLDREIYDRVSRQLAGPPSAPPSRRIFISRRNTRGRNLLNENELVEAMAARGLEVIEAESLSLLDKARLFRDAELVVGLGGSGMFNVAFCPAGTRVVSIESNNTFIHNHSLLFGSLGHRFAFILGKEDPTDPEPIHKNWTIDVERAAAAIRML